MTGPGRCVAAGSVARLRGWSRGVGRSALLARSRSIMTAFAVLFALGTGSCSLRPAPLAKRGRSTRITGSVTYHEQIPLPTGALVRVSLQDFSKAGAPHAVV